ncbi:glycoside hydrolase family 79 protein [Phlebiopsis gigantea 11061_1 CR5-6]|uniref:Glycoside hydrolase family 79 protein n=1 Tax=Phlebiopsis gigantea (strain 11061_1 CR5-6) TaxID=745531 RepID=A0A0C3NN87_PHLG1|nr:glycoside hydrolase family 79 protein [Phlebiopsis gigantea 11061_1 CR5-6]
MLWPTFLAPVVFLAYICVARASITVYGLNGQAQQQTHANGQPDASATSSAINSAFTSIPAYNNVVLQAPPVPTNLTTQFDVPVQSSSQGVAALSIELKPGFYGFSVEFSVVNQVVGINSTFLNVQFLNLMSIITQRAGSVVIRVGGNSQETATLVDSLANGKSIEKDKTNSTGPTETPTLLFTPEILYMLANVSALLPVKWYLGIPFNDTTNLRLGIAEAGEAILGNHLLGFQVGNEPDWYANHKNRPLNYSQEDYFGEFGVVVQAIANDNKITVRNNLIGPSVSTGPWTPESVFNTGFVSAYDSALGALSVEHYPTDNCAAAFPDGGFGPPKDPQTVFPEYLTHQSGLGIVAPYLNSTNYAQQVGKPFLMFETNTASCGGFPGISDSFGAALWAADYGMTMAVANFSAALLHVGGQDDTYNPFTPPPTNMSDFDQWTIGPVFYSAVILAEAFGTSGTAQINGQLSRLALFNYVTDPSGASTIAASISFDGTTPSQVMVKYLLAPSVAEKVNITWAGQTLSGVFQSDGRFRGTESISTVQCDQSSGTCTIEVPAPGFALVFLSSAALAETEPSSTVTFSTSTVTGKHTATVNPTVLATSNGHSGADRARLDSTSRGSSGAASRAELLPGLCTAFLAAFSALLLLGVHTRT